MKSVDYKKNSNVMELFKGAPFFKKVEKTYFRLPKVDEVGKKLITYVVNPDGNGYRKEAEVNIPENRVLARNDYVVGVNASGEKVFNEWTKPFSEVIESYGHDAFNSLTHEYKPYTQIKPIRLLLLTAEVMALMGLMGHNELPIQVAWSEEPMIAYVGDYLTENGYSISQVDIKLQYEKVV